MLTASVDTLSQAAVDGLLLLPGAVLHKPYTVGSPPHPPPGPGDVIVAQARQIVR
eukprot:m.276567 g.276567  ORF g.276567 m.276567 type:complete len:55 (+) comp16145_c0_seq3:5027-5191(+)